MKSRFILTLVLGLITPALIHASDAPDHFMNDKKNLHKDPNYTPGAYPAPDSFAAKTVFQNQKENLVTEDKILDPNWAVSLGVGEVRYASIKNKTAVVPGYFRNYIGVAQFHKKTPKYMELLIDVNSMDTAVPGRNNRILKIFFESMKPELGASVVKLNRFKKKKGNVYNASGIIELNGQTKPISAEISIENKKGTWIVKTETPISFLISDFDFGKRTYALMKECNHISIGNKVDVTTTIYLR